MVQTLVGATQRALVRIIQWLETENANPVDVYYCYRLLLDRRPDAVGWEGWSELLQLGMARPRLVDGFLGTEEYRMKNAAQPATAVTLDHGVMYVDPNDYLIGESIIQQHSYEPHVTAVLQRLLSPESVFVDVGANMGWFVLLAATLANRGKVIAIEPNFNNTQLIYQTMLANKLDNVHVYPFAASDKETILRLSAIHSNGTVAAVDEAGGAYEYVRGVALDDLLQDEPVINVLKIDIEGYEPMALKGMLKTLAKHKPVVLSEFHPKFIRHSSGIEPEEYLASLSKLGYALGVIMDDGQEVSASPEVVMQKWHERNQEHGVEDLIHVDLIARPM